MIAEGAGEGGMERKKVAGSTTTAQQEKK